MIDKNYDNRSGDIIAAICGFLAGSSNGKETFEFFFKYVYANLKKFKESKNCKSTFLSIFFTHSQHIFLLL